MVCVWPCGFILRGWMGLVEAQSSKRGSRVALAIHKSRQPIVRLRSQILLDALGAGHCFGEESDGPAQPVVIPPSVHPGRASFRKGWA